MFFNGNVLFSLSSPFDDFLYVFFLRDVLNLDINTKYNYNTRKIIENVNKSINQIRRETHQSNKRKFVCDIFLSNTRFGLQKSYVLFFPNKSSDKIFLKKSLEFTYLSIYCVSRT